MNIYKSLLTFICFTMFIILNIPPSFAQSISPDLSSDPGVLVSSAPISILQSKGDSLPSIVNIKAVDAPAMQLQNGTPRMASMQRFGHGVIIDPSGIIVTNTHIIANAQHIYVDLANGNIFEAIVLHSGQSDFSFIKITTPFLLKAITWGNSSQIQIGKPIIAPENTASNSQNTLKGQVTNLIKDDPAGDIELLELKLSLQPGDSGGPILDQQGRLLGIVMAKRKSDNTESYAIASNIIQQEYFKFKGSLLIAANNI